MRSDNRRALIILTVLVTVLVGIAAYLFPKYFEQATKTIQTGASLEAMRNPYLGATRFLERLDVPVDSQLHFADLAARPAAAPTSDDVELPTTADTLVMTYSYVLDNPVFHEPLIDWVRNGGHLMLELGEFSDEQEKDEERNHNGFREFLGVSLESSSFFDIDEEALTEVEVWEDSGVLDVNFSPYRYLVSDREDLQLDFWDANGSHLMEFREGDGVVTVVSDMDIWTNDHIAEYDHAALLSHLLAERNGKVFFILETDMPSLWSMIWMNGAEAASAFLILVALLIWRLYNRFGPIVIIQDNIRRSLREHLQASGRFLWQHRLSAQLLEQVRSELFSHLELRHPQWRLKDEDERAQWVAEKTELDPQVVDNALRHRPTQATEFTNIIRTLQTLRNRL